MALLTQVAPAGRRRTRAAVLLVATLGGCALFESIKNDEPGFGFSHRRHIEEEGLECADCHPSVEDSDEPGMPTLGQCMLCHEDIDVDKPPEERIETLFVDGRYAAARYSALDDEIVFSHLAHVQGEYDCASCHGPVAESERVGTDVRVTMAACERCHETERIANECSTCHTEIGPDWAPPNHAQNWIKVHGRPVRERSTQLVHNCSMCHTESSCTYCHQTQLPEDHTNYWRLRGHSIVSSLDRDRCWTCHRDDSCTRCHQEVLPLSHTGMWGSPLSAHCLGCHLPLPANGCIVCHEGTPSHSLAAPKPPNHNPAMNCRQCHGLTAPLPHVDNGDDCNICHQ